METVINSSNNNFVVISANSLADCVVGCTYISGAKEIVVLINGELNYINPDSYILNNGVKEYYVYGKLSELDANAPDGEHILGLDDNY